MKSDKLYKSISEVAKMLNLVNTKTGKPNTHTIRFWETQFNQIKPKKFSGSRRYYDNESIVILKKIKFLLKDRKMTIEGAKKLLKKNSHLDLDVNNITNINDFEILKNKIKNISLKLKNLKKD